MAPVRAGRGSIKYNVDIGETRHRDKPVDSAGRDWNSQTRGALQSVRFRIDTDQRTHLEALGQAKYLDHQIGTDIAGPNDRNLGLRGHFRSLP
jgi:hypothetical protein